MEKHKVPTVSLFIPCLVDQVYPDIGISMAKILDHLGYNLIYDHRQTCCGQPAFNAGHRKEAKKVASKFIDVFNDSEIIVGPSGSCTAMVKNYYPPLFNNDKLETKALDMSKKIFEFSQFLDNENQIQNISGKFSGKVGFHNSCHSLRELGIISTPQKILDRINMVEVLQPKGEALCCGFGGLFSIKFDAIAATMAKTRIEMFTDLGVETIITNDPGCLMHMQQEILDLKLDVQIFHLTEFLAKAMSL